MEVFYRQSRIIDHVTPSDTLSTTLAVSHPTPTSIRMIMWISLQIGKQQACLSLVGLGALGKILYHEIKQTVCLFLRILNDMSQELDALNQELSEVRG